MTSPAAGPSAAPQTQMPGGAPSLVPGQPVPPGQPVAPVPPVLPPDFGPPELASGFGLADGPGTAESAGQPIPENPSSHREPKAPKAPRTRVVRVRDWAYPPEPVPDREILSALPPAESVRPPLLFVPGFRHGAWCFAEHWLEVAAERGYPSYAVSLRGHGASPATSKRATIRHYTHDVLAAAASLPHQAVLIGHGAGALAVAGALARYPARAGVLMAPIIYGWPTAWAALGSNPLTVLGAFGSAVRVRAGQVFSALDRESARRYLERSDRASALAQYQLLWHREPEPPAGAPPMLVVGGRDDSLVPERALARVARHYGVEPLVASGVGHDMMLDGRWREPLAGILDWLDAEAPDREPTKPLP